MLFKGLLSIVLWPYFLLLFLGLVLPSDANHGLLSPKSISFLFALGGMLFFVVFKRRLHDRSLHLFLFSAFFSLFLSLWLLLGIFMGQRTESFIDEGKLFILTASVVLMTLLYIYENQISAQYILKFIIFSNFFYSTVKISLLILHMLHGIELWEYLDRWGIRYMSMDIVGKLVRFQTSVDIVTPFLFFFVLTDVSFKLYFSKKFKVLFILISLISVFLSFSRFLIATSIFSFILYGMTLSFSKKLKISIFFFGIVCIFLALVGIDRVEEVVMKRFSSDASVASDDVRIHQIHALIQEYEAHPILGNGLGAFSSKVVRDPKLPHSYEVQWVAFLVQFGWLGIFCLLLLLCPIPYHIFLLRNHVMRLPLFLLFFLFLFSGFTNPFLISLTSGIMYTLFLLPKQILG